MIRKSSQGGRRPAQQYPINVCGYLVGMQRSWSQALLSGIYWQDEKQWVQTEAQEIPFKLRNAFFLVRVVRHCHRLPRDASETPVSEMFKTQLDTVWGSLLWASRDLHWITAKGPFLLNCPVRGNASPKVLHCKSQQAKQTHSPPGLQNVICNVFLMRSVYWSTLLLKFVTADVIFRQYLYTSFLKFSHNIWLELFPAVMDSAGEIHTMLRRNTSFTFV